MFRGLAEGWRAEPDWTLKEMLRTGQSEGGSFVGPRGQGAAIALRPGACYLPPTMASSLQNPVRAWGYGAVLAVLAGSMTASCKDGSRPAAAVDAAVRESSPPSLPSGSTEPTQKPASARTSQVLSGQVKVILLTQSTGGILWAGGPGREHTPLLRQLASEYDAGHGKDYVFEQRWFPDGPSPYDSNNPGVYWKLWVKGEAPKPEQTLDAIADTYDVIVFKHCYVHAHVYADYGPEEFTKNPDTIEYRAQTFKLQYEDLKKALRKHSDTLFVVWTLAPETERSATLSSDGHDGRFGQRARDFAAWVRDVWDEPGDNLFVFDFWTLEAGGQDKTFADPAHILGPNDAHPNWDFAAQTSPKLLRRIVDVIEGRGDVCAATGEPSAACP